MGKRTTVYTTIHITRVKMTSRVEVKVQGDEAKSLTLGGPNKIVFDDYCKYKDYNTP
jgi:hypothetical protein